MSRRRESKRLIELKVADVVNVTSIEEGSYGYNCFSTSEVVYGKIFLGHATCGTTVGIAIENKFKGN